MTNTRLSLTRAMYALIIAALTISLIMTAPSLSVDADPGSDISEWTRESTPSQDGWVLAPDSEILDIATEAPGAVAYAIVRLGGTSARLLKSSDHAATWTDITEGVEDELERKSLGNLCCMEHLTCAPDDSDFVAVTVVLGGSSDIYVFISNDGGMTFRSTGIVQHASVLNEVFDFAVSPAVGDARELAIGGIDNSGTGAIFRATAIGDFATAWEDARYDGWHECHAIFDIEFAPSWVADRTILAVTTTEADGHNIHLQSGTWGATEGWNTSSTPGIAPVLIIADVELPEIARWIAGITLPSDYSGQTATKRYAWVWVNYLELDPTPADGPTIGEIFRVANTGVIRVTQQIHGRPWLTNVYYQGDIASGKAIAGLLGKGNPETLGDLPADPCQGVQVYRYLHVHYMDICCPAWKAACKPPTGSLGMAAFYVTEEKAYAVALGSQDCYDESAWSWSFDDGDTWNQLSLIDTHISFLSDVAVSPDCNQTMLVSVNLGPSGEWFGDPGWWCDSVWYRAESLAHYGFDEYSGRWMRTWSGQFEGFDLDTYEGLPSILSGLYVPLEGEDYFKHGRLKLAPEETYGATVYLVDFGVNKIYWNDMHTLGCWRHGTSTIDNIADLAVKDARTIYALGYDGKVAMSDDFAIGWRHTSVASGLENGWTIAVWGDHILVGGQDGDVSYSADGGQSFSELRNGLVDGLVTVAFDSYFGSNDTIYVAMAEAGENNGIYRWVVGESTSWTNLAAQPYDYTGLVLDKADGNPLTSPATGGVLYASYLDVDGTGVARCLTPADEADWDYLTEGLTSEQFIIAPGALKICGCLSPDTASRLFAIGVDAEEAPYDMEEGEFGTVWSFTDCHAKSVLDLMLPADGILIPADPDDDYNLPFTASWERVCDALGYDIQFAEDADFDQLIDLPQYTGVFPVDTENPSWLIGPDFMPTETYYWRVRAVEAGTGQAIRSWWSESRMFSVAPGPDAGVTLVSPEPGATGVPITNIAFIWNSETEFDSYNWVLSPNADLSSPVASQTGLTTESHACTGTLAYDTPYYWRITAIKDGVPMSQAIATFRTVAEEDTPFLIPCFIATAAYGTPMAEEIQILRGFRDGYLLTNFPGRAFVDLYYNVSPPIAQFIDEQPSLKPMVRTALVPAVAMSTIVVNTTPAQKATAVGLVVLISVVLVVWATKRRRMGPQNT